MVAPHELHTVRKLSRACFRCGDSILHGGRYLPLRLLHERSLRLLRGDLALCEKCAASITQPRGRKLPASPPESSKPV